MDKEQEKECNVLHRIPVIQCGNRGGGTAAVAKILGCIELAMASVGNGGHSSHFRTL